MGLKRPAPRIGLSILLGLILASCSGGSDVTSSSSPKIPRGFVNRLEIQVGARVLSFGPFVGYYFKPSGGGDLQTLDFICFNERSFYTRDVPADTPLFEGQAVWRQLPETGRPVPAADGRRIVPVFFEAAPAAWRDSRPEPREEYRHFHSAHDARGAVHYGYWLRHVALARFTYDMGGRVDQGSPLYHHVQPGVDRGFARVIEFDHGPRQAASAVE